jgi:hypothetical protein
VRDRAYRIAFAACAAAALVPILGVKYLPMVDLPQHAAQVSVLAHWNDPAYGFAGQYELHPFTPYGACYLVGWAFARLLDIHAAMSLVVALSVVGLPLSLHYLLRTVGGERWWSLLGFPLAYGFSFYWGFLNFLVALPLMVVFVARGFGHARRGTWTAVPGLVALSVALFFAHAYAIALGLTLVGLEVVRRSRSIGALARGGLPLVVPGAMLVAWYVSFGRTEAASRAAEVPTVWELGRHRLVELPGLVLGRGDDPLMVAFGAALIVLVALSVRPLRAAGRSWADAVPLALVLAGYLLTPRAHRQICCMYQRFPVLILPFASLLLPPLRRVAYGRALRAGLCLVVVSWMAILTVRFVRSDREARLFDEILRHMEPRRSALGLVFLRESATPPRHLWLHHPVWYQAVKGGRCAGSEGQLPIMIARLRPGDPRRVGHEFGWQPELFNWADHGRYDYYVVRAAVDLGPSLFRDATRPVLLRARSGPWWLYEAGPWAQDSGLRGSGRAARRQYSYDRSMARARRLPAG